MICASDNKRRYCNLCALPARSCICACVRPVAHKIGIGILQHPKEQTCAKGTARLAQLCLSDCRIWVAESIDALAEMQAWLQQKPTFLLFPPEPGEDYLTASQVRQDFQPSELQLLLLDGTWRKAYKMLQSNPLLQGLPRLALEGELVSDYAIRKAPSAQRLSTLEAIYYGLHQLEGNSATDFAPLRLALRDFVHLRQGFSPTTRPG